MEIRMLCEAKKGTFRGGPARVASEILWILQIFFAWVRFVYSPARGASEIL